MKSDAFMFAMIVDQVASRGGTDRVPAALEALETHVGASMMLQFERTAGDELQGLTAHPAAVVAAVVHLTRLGGWRIGVGAGEVELPLPSSTREARGAAYVAAREAVDTARGAPSGLAFVLAPAGSGPVSAGSYRETSPGAVDAETALWLLRFVLEGRSREGWELVDLLDKGLSNTKAAASLGISPSAASQRLARAHRVEADRAAVLATRLLDGLRPTSAVEP